MAHDPGETLEAIQHWLTRFRAGDDKAENELMRCAKRRIDLAASRMLNEFPRLRSLQDTSEVRQELTVRRFRTALRKTQPATPTLFLGLVRRHLRWLLLDQMEEFFNPEGLAKVPGTLPRSLSMDDSGFEAGVPAVSATAAAGLERLELLRLAHASLPEKLWEVFYLRAVEERNAAEVAVQLGISERESRQRWQEARLVLRRSWKDYAPGASGRME